MLNLESCVSCEKAKLSQDKFKYLHFTSTVEFFHYTSILICPYCPGFMTNIVIACNLISIEMLTTSSQIWVSNRIGSYNIHIPLYKLYFSVSIWSLGTCFILPTQCNMKCHWVCLKIPRNVVIIAELFSLFFLNRLDLNFKCFQKQCLVLGVTFQDFRRSDHWNQTKSLYKTSELIH